MEDWLICKKAPLVKYCQTHKHNREEKVTTEFHISTDHALGKTCLDRRTIGLFVLLTDARNISQAIQYT